MRSLHSIYLGLPEGWRKKLRFLLRFPVARSYVISELGVNGTDNLVSAALRRHVPIDLIVHVGAHLAEEGWLYESLGAETVLWIEADPELYRRLTEKISARASGSTTHIAYQALVSEIDDAEIQLHRYSNDGASNSVYHLSEDFARSLPSLTETGEVLSLRSESLSSVLRNSGVAVGDFSCSLLVLDVQGHELAVLKGATAHTISAFSYVCVEVSMQSVYSGGALGEDVLSWLANSGFSPMTDIPEHHGDILLEHRVAVAD